MTDIHQPEPSDLDRPEARTPTIDIHCAYVRRPEDGRLRRKVKKALKDTLRGPEGRGVVLTADSGAGKTTLLDRVTQAVPELGQGPDATCRFIRLDVPAPCTLKDLGRAVCLKAGYELRNETLTAGRIWTRAREQLKDKRIRFVMLDEVHNVTGAAKDGEDVQIRETLKTLMVDKDWHVGLILVGLPSVVSFIGADQQVRRRVSFDSINPLRPKNAGHLAQVVTDFAKSCDLRCHGSLVGDIVPRLMHASEYRFGLAIEMLRGAIDIALDENGCTELNKEHFACDFADRTNNAAFANPFLATDWAALDCTLTNITRPEQMVVEEEVGPRRRGRKRIR